MPKQPIRELPAWYYRLLKEPREIYPEDFDEDLSDLEVDTNCSEEEISGEHEVQGGEIVGNDDEDTENSDYEGSNESEDVESDRSYDGSDADYYYELKEEREDRKKQLRSAKSNAILFHKTKIKEAQSAYEAVKFGATKSPVDLHLFDPKTSNHFRLYSTGWVQHCFSFSPRRSPYIEFYDLNENHPQQLSEDEQKEIAGHIYFHADLTTHFAQFSPPKHASRDEIKLRSYDTRYKFAVQFFSHDFVRLKVGQEFLFEKEPRPLEAPESFEFFGVRVNMEKEQLQRAADAKKRKRSVSPRDTWFERTHFMGYWSQGFWSMGYLL